MSDDEVDSALRKLCKCGNPFMRYVRLKEVGAGYSFQIIFLHLVHLYNIMNF